MSVAHDGTEVGVLLGGLEDIVGGEAERLRLTVAGSAFGGNVEDGAAESAWRKRNNGRPLPSKGTPERGTDGIGGGAPGVLELPELAACLLIGGGAEVAAMGWADRKCRVLPGGGAMRLAL